MSDPYAFIPISADAFELARTRCHNFGECEWCTSTDFAPGSLFCYDCHEKQMRGVRQCANDCGHSIPLDSTPVCRFCEKHLLIDAVQGTDDILSWPVDLIRRLFRDDYDLHRFLEAWGWKGEVDDDRMILRRENPKEE